MSVNVSKRRVLFLCTENSCRSQMAEGLLRAIAPDKFRVSSAGTAPTTLNQNAVKVMAEIGIDTSHHESKSVDKFAHESFDYAVTVCGSLKSGSCPAFSGRADRLLHWPFDDPAEAVGDEEEVLEVFRHARDQIRDRVECFLRREAVARPFTKPIGGNDEYL